VHENLYVRPLVKSPEKYRGSRGPVDNNNILFGRRGAFDDSGLNVIRTRTNKRDEMCVFRDTRLQHLVHTRHYFERPNTLDTPKKQYIKKMLFTRSNVNNI